MTARVALAAGVRTPLGARRWAYLGDDGGERLALARGPLAGVEAAPVGPLRERFAWELRDGFLDWLGQAGELNDTLEWWSSETRARNVFTMLYNRVCAVAAARELVGEDLLLVCGTPAQQRAIGAEPAGTMPPPARRLHAAARTLRTWARVTPRPLLRLPASVSRRARTVLESEGAYRRRVVAGAGRADGFAGDGTVLLFTWVDERSFDADGRFRDPYFGRLAELLEERGARVAIVPDVLPSLPLDQAVARLRASGPTFLLPDAYLEAEDWADARRRAAFFRPRLPEADLAGVPVAELAREHVEQHRDAHAVALRWAALVRRLAAAGVAPERIVYPHEGHSWEHALEWAVRRELPGTRLVAFENANFSRLALSMYPGPRERALAPGPDRIVTNGETYRETLLAEGFPAAQVATGCALRHEYLHEATPKAPREGPIRVLVATSIHEGDAVELIDRAWSALGAEPGVEVRIKCHPVVDVRSVRAAISAGAAARIVEEPIGRLLEDSDVMLYTYSVVCYEALASGVPPVHVKPESMYPLDQLESAEDVHWQARTDDELRGAVRTAAGLDGDARADWLRRARATVAHALAPVRPECAEAFLG